MATPDELDPLLHRGIEFRLDECEWKHGGSCSTDAARRLSPKGRPIPVQSVLDDPGLLMEAQREISFVERALGRRSQFLTPLSLSKSGRE